MILVIKQFFQPLLSIFESKQGHVATWGPIIRGLIVFHASVTHILYADSYISLCSMLVQKWAQVGPANLLSRWAQIRINRLTPNDPYMVRTAPLISKRCILYIYSTNIGTEYFKHALYSPFFLFKMQFVS